MRLLIVIALMISFASASTIAQENRPPTDVAGSLLYFSPSATENYTDGFGAEAKIRFWRNRNLGFSLSLGLADWLVNEEPVITGDSTFAVGVSMTGSVALVSLGASVLFRPTLSDNIAVTVEGGLRLVNVQSAAGARAVAADSFGNVMVYEGDIRMASGIVGLIGANLEASLTPNISLIGGIGYQFDIVKGEVAWLDFDLGDNELKAFFVRGGITIHRRDIRK